LKAAATIKSIQKGSALITGCGTRYEINGCFVQTVVQSVKEHALPKPIILIIPNHKRLFGYAARAILKRMDAKLEFLLKETLQMSFDEFFAGRRPKDGQYPDWQEWLEKRGITGGERHQPPQWGMEKEKVERGGDNFRFVCWGDVTELKRWERR
jgi:hypothetical protein